MFVFRLVPTLVFFLLLSDQVPLLSGPAYAQQCCMCGMCRGGCRCGCPCGVTGTLGTYDPASGTGTLQLQAVTDKAAKVKDVKIVVPDTLLRGKLKEGVLGQFSLVLSGSLKGVGMYECTNFSVRPSLPDRTDDLVHVLNERTYEVEVPEKK